MKKLLLAIVFIPVIGNAEGPLFRQKDPVMQQEFENVYQDIRKNIPSSRIVGTTTNDNAAAGYVGESARSSVTAAVSSPGTLNWFDITNITLTAGDWDISGQVIFTLNGATESVALMAVTSTSGNSTTGQIDGDNRLPGPIPVAGNDTSATISNYRVSLSATTIYYLKARCDFSAGTPQAYGRISARRVR